MSERRQGWGSLTNAAKAHYFETDGRSLCGKWIALLPYWESNQELGTAPDNGTCRGCWTKRKKQEAAA